MAAGTVSLTMNSKNMTGNSTNFTHEIKASDFIVVVVGGVTYTLGVAVVQSDTSLTLNTDYNGPTTSGLTWTPIPAQTLVGITAQIAADTARAIRGLNYEKDNWQKVYSASGDISVNLPDGSNFNGPSWINLAASLKDKANSSDLGSAAAANIQKSAEDTDSGKLLAVGAFGLGSSVAPVAANWTNRNTNGFYRTPSNGGSLPKAGANYVCQSLIFDPNFKVVTGFRLGGTLSYFARSFINGIWGAPIEFYTTGNTTVDTNNFIKKASPIARISDSPSLMESDFTAGGFAVAGLASVNAEAEGVRADKVGPGVYRITGAQGLSAEGWTMEVPQDSNGNRLCFIETDIAEDGVITLRVFSRRFDVNTANIVAGDPMNIPCGRWIDLRLQMPEDSAWNKREREEGGSRTDAG